MAVGGEGGMLLTDSKEIYEKAILLANMGRTDSKAVFWSDFIGYEYVMSNLTASLALAQLERVDELMEKKRKIFDWYFDRLNGVDGIKIVREKPGCKSNLCYPSILLEESVETPSDDVLACLSEQNIHARPAFPQMSRFPAFEQRFKNPVSRLVERNGISLPSAANLEEADIDLVCRHLVRLIGRE